MTPTKVVIIPVFSGSLTAVRVIVDRPSTHSHYQFKGVAILNEDVDLYDAVAGYREAVRHAMLGASEDLRAVVWDIAAKEIRDCNRQHIRPRVRSTEG